MTAIEAMLQTLNSELTDLAHRLSEEEGLRLQQAEEALRAWSRDCERRLLQGCYAERATTQDVGDCPQCDHALERQEVRRRWVHTQAGDLLVWRWYCRCPACGHRCFPWDSSQGVRDGYSPSVAETMCRLSARLDFREACEELAHQGIEVSECVESGATGGSMGRDIGCGAGNPTSIPRFGSTLVRDYRWVSNALSGWLA